MPRKRQTRHRNARPSSSASSQDARGDAPAGHAVLRREVRRGLGRVGQHGGAEDGCPGARIRPGLAGAAGDDAEPVGRQGRQRHPLVCVKDLVWAEPIAMLNGVPLHDFVSSHAASLLAAVTPLDSDAVLVRGATNQSEWSDHYLNLYDGGVLFRCSEQGKT
eukprot:2917201-Rhodomonas_salina.1